jgi:hypothetical protein
MKTFFALCSVLSLISAPALAQTSNEYKLGMASFQTKNYKEASIFFLGAMSSEPKNPKAFYYAGYCLYLTGRKEDAFKTFKLLVNTFPNSKEAIRASAFLKQNDRNYSSRLSSTSGSTSGIRTIKSEDAKNDSPDYYINKLVVVNKPRGKLPAVSASYISEIKQLLAALPVSVLRALCENHAKISLYPSVVEDDFRMQNTRPRGWDEGTSWANSPAFCRGTEVVVSQYVTSRTTGETEDASDAVGVIRHEVGHAFDHCLDISDSEEFKHTYRLEAARVPAELHKKFDYYLQSGDGGPSETFAELFNAKFGGYTDRARGDIATQVKAHFPNCNKIMETKLRELDSEK